MKIGIDIRTLMDARYSGVSEYTFNLVREILKLDAPSASSGQAANEYQLFYNSFKKQFKPPLTKGGRGDFLSAAVVQWKWPNKILNYFLFKLFNWPKVDKKLGVDTFFMPHINFIGLSTQRRSMSFKDVERLTRKILTVHDLSFLRYPEFFSCRKNFWHKMINVKKLVKKFDVIVAVSENTKRDIVELCGAPEDKVKVIYSGIGKEYRQISPNDANERQKFEEVRKKYGLPEKFTPHLSGGASAMSPGNRPKGAGFILFLGTLEPRKNIEGLIEAYNALRAMSYALRDYKLVIAGGKGWKGENIYKTWKKSPFKEDIIFTGYINSEDKPYLYNLASVFVYPSFYEGFGFPPLEAMASSIPVITSAVSSLPEIVGEVGILIDPYNIADITRAMAEILNNEELREDLIKRGLERVKQFSWEKAAREYLNLMVSQF